MSKPERMFERVGIWVGKHWCSKVSRAVDEHSEHIEKIEAALEGTQLVLLRVTNILDKLSVWQRDVAGELANSLGLDLRPENEDPDAK